MVVLIHNVPVRFVNQLKAIGLSRSHPVHVATAAAFANQHEGKKKWWKELEERGWWWWW